MVVRSGFDAWYVLLLVVLISSRSYFVPSTNLISSHLDRYIDDLHHDPTRQSFTNPMSLMLYEIPVNVVLHKHAFADSFRIL
jgi:hypothetical protein